jgi:hypothetical protein
MGTRTFKYENKEYTCEEKDILRRCGNEAQELVKCSKERYGFKVVYKLKQGMYDDRDSSLVSTFISYFYLTGDKRVVRDKLIM